MSKPKRKPLLGEGWVEDIDLSEVDDSIIDKDDLEDVVQELRTVAHQFSSLGSVLRIDQDEMASLKVIYKDRHKEGLREVITLFLNQKYNLKKVLPPSWPPLVAAVSNSMGGNNHTLAKNIAESHATETAVTKVPTEETDEHITIKDSCHSHSQTEPTPSHHHTTHKYHKHHESEPTPSHFTKPHTHQPVTHTNSQPLPNRQLPNQTYRQQKSEPPVPTRLLMETPQRHFQFGAGRGRMTAIREHTGNTTQGAYGSSCYQGDTSYWTSGKQSGTHEPFTAGSYQNSSQAQQPQDVTSQPQPPTQSAHTHNLSNMHPSQPVEHHKATSLSPDVQKRAVSIGKTPPPKSSVGRGRGRGSRKVCGPDTKQIYSLSNRNTSPYSKPIARGFPRNSSQRKVGGASLHTSESGGSDTKGFSSLAGNQNPTTPSQVSLAISTAMNELSKLKLTQTQSRGATDPQSHTPLHATPLSRLSSQWSSDSSLETCSAYGTSSTVESSLESQPSQEFNFASSTPERPVNETKELKGDKLGLIKDKEYTKAAVPTKYLPELYIETPSPDKANIEQLASATSDVSTHSGGYSAESPHPTSPPRTTSNAIHTQPHPSESVPPTEDEDAEEQQKITEKLDNMMIDKDRTDVGYFNMYFAGPSGLGKTTTKKRLIKLMVNIDSLPEELKEHCSTLLAECNQVLAIVDVSKSTLTSDHEMAEGDSEETRLNKETRAIYKYLLGMGAGETIKKTPKSNSVEGAYLPLTNPEDEGVNKINPTTATTSTNSSEEDERVAEIVTVDVDKVVKHLREIVGSGEYAKGLMGKILLNLVDIGGQPGFTEMIPFLTKGVGIFLAFFPLDKNLDDPCEVPFERDRYALTLYSKKYSYREILSQFLSSVSHHIPKDPTDNPKFADRLRKMREILPVVTLIGTCKDQLEMQVKKELLLDKLSKFPNEDLSKAIKHALEKESGSFTRKDQLGTPEVQNAIDQLLSSEEFMKDVDKLMRAKLAEKEKDIRSLSSKFKGLLLHLEGQEFFAVDNLKNTDKDLDSLHKHLHNIFIAKFKDAKLPILPSQLLLGVVLKKEFSIVSMDDCTRIGEELNMDEDDVKFAILYLSRFIGALIHRTDIKDDQDWFKLNVICNPQIVFDSISALIVEPLKKLHCHDHKLLFTDNERENWKHRGQFSLETIRKCQPTNLETHKLIPVDKLLLLLEHSHLLAKINKIRENGEKNFLYFMPAILECATPDKLQKTPVTNEDTPSPIKITFKHGCVPMGLFIAMISELVSRGSGDDQPLGMRWNLADSRVKRNLVSFHVSCPSHLVTLVAHVHCIEIQVERNRIFSLYKVCSQVLSTILYIIKEINPSFVPIVAFDCPPHCPEKLCKLYQDNFGTRFTCEHCKVVNLTSHQVVWFQQEVELGGYASMDALPCKDSSLSFNWSNERPRLSEKGNSLEVKKVEKHHCEGYFRCEVFKDGKSLFSVYHCLKIATPLQPTTEPSIEQLLERQGLTSHDIDQECTNDHLLKLSHHLGDWEFIARHLGLTDAEIGAIKYDVSIELKRHNTLRKWKTNNLLTGTATYRLLLMALLESECNELAVRVCKLIKPNH